MAPVSVIIPTYNRAHLLPTAIQSVLNQTFPNFELIIVDDGSTDHTKDVVSAFDDARIHYYYTPNQGAAAARNFGVKQACAPMVAFLDSDDEWLPEKLATQLPITERHKLTVAGCFMMREGEQTLYTPVLKQKQDILLGCRLNPGTTLMCSKHLLLETPFDVNLKRFEDWDWFIQQYLKGQDVTILPTLLGRVHLRPGKSAETLPSLKSLEAKYQQLIPLDQIIFQAGIHVEQASFFMWNKRYWKSLQGLIKAFWLYPQGFYVVIPSLKRVLIKETHERQIYYI